MTLKKLLNNSGQMVHNGESMFLAFSAFGHQRWGTNTRMQV